MGSGPFPLGEHANAWAALSNLWVRLPQLLLCFMRKEWLAPGPEQTEQVSQVRTSAGQFNGKVWLNRRQGHWPRSISLLGKFWFACALCWRQTSPISLRSLFPPCREGYNAWRDATKPSEILAKLCKDYRISGPFMRPGEIQVGAKVFKGQTVFREDENGNKVCHSLTAL